MNERKKKLTIRWRSKYYSCYFYDYDKNGFFVFLFGPKLETIWTHCAYPTESNYCLKWTRCEQKGIITIAIATAIAIGIAIAIVSTVMLFSFCLFSFVCLKRVTSCCWIIYFLIWLCGISNVICNVIWLPMHYKYTLHSKSHSLCIPVNNFYCKKEPINLSTVTFSNKLLFNSHLYADQISKKVQ